MIPRIVRTGTLRANGRDVEAIGDGNLFVEFDATADETEDTRSMHETIVRITIEPADATPEEAPHGSALNYLAELKGLMQGAIDGYAISEQTERALRRAMSLANATSLAILAERRSAR